MAWAESTSVPSSVFIHPAVWPQQTWDENSGVVALSGGAVTPSNTTSPGPKSTSIPTYYQVASLSIQPFGHN